jgi:UPF0755 protein
MKNIILYCIFFVFITLVALLFSHGPLQNSLIVYIPANATVSDISNKLERKSVIRNPLIFKFFFKLLLKDKKMVAGEFVFPKYNSLLNVILTITNPNNVYKRKLTIPEGYTIDQIKKILLENQYLEGPLPLYIPEGSILPETYVYYKGDSRSKIINQMQLAMRKYIEDLWEKRDKNLIYRNINEALTLASIVEKEAILDRERALIAGLFINRLKIRMRLQSDPTVVYGLKNKKYGSPITKKDLQSKHSFNTYLIYGLPPHPIANPGKESIYAVFFPAKTNHLYFVADGKGGHNFSADLKTHNDYVKQWRKVEKKLK